jgi:hypothetical protein
VEGQAVDHGRLGAEKAGSGSRVLEMNALHTLIATAALVGLLMGEARAGDVNTAEHDRVADEMDRLAQRQIWAGVERKYRELERLGIPLTEKEHLQGAYAARELGDVYAVYQRLKKAAQLNGTKETVNWLWDIDNHYGQVELLSVPARSTVLEPTEMPFDPNQRRAVETAISVSKDDGVFVGMLPRGEYTFGGQRFSVEPGISVRIEVSHRMRRQGIIDPVIVYRELPGAIVGTPPAAPEPPSPDPAPTTPDTEQPQ